MKKFRFKISQRISDHLIQALLIFASVFMAFWLNEYRIEKNELKNSIEAQKSIVKELKVNLDILERWLPYHKSIFDKTVKVLNNHSDTLTTFNPYSFVDGEKGYRKEIITDYSWDLIKEIKIDIDTKILINRIYEQQKYVENAFGNFFEFLNERNLFRENLVLGNYMLYAKYMGEIYGQERAMIKQYRIAIMELEKKLNN